MPPKLVSAPVGQQVHRLLSTDGRLAAQAHAAALGQPDLFERVEAVALEEPVPSFLHSALCAMSLPVRRPVDDTKPIIRQDGQYTLAITPRAVLHRADGLQAMRILGVPYGSLPRLILIHIMTEAVRTRSRHILLGSSFSDWMRRMGFRTASHGPRGSATLVRNQLDRLLACEWMIRWDNETAAGENEFAVKEVKLTSDYAGRDSDGGFSREILLTEGFFDHLSEHAVPLDETAIRQLRDSATALDLYTWLAYRLPRIGSTRGVTLGWQQLAVHFGNDGKNIRKFRQTIRDAWDRHVSAVYPEARASFDTLAVRLHASPAPLQRRRLSLVGTGIRLDSKPSPAVNPPVDGPLGLIHFLRIEIGPEASRSWFGDAAVAEEAGEVVLLLGTRFKADYARQHFATALGRAARSAGLSNVPRISHRIAP